MGEIFGKTPWSTGSVLVLLKLFAKWSNLPEVQDRGQREPKEMPERQKRRSRRCPGNRGIDP